MFRYMLVRFCNNVHRTAQGRTKRLQGGIERECIFLRLNARFVIHYIFMSAVGWQLPRPLV